MTLRKVRFAAPAALMGFDDLRRQVPMARSPSATPPGNAIPGLSDGCRLKPTDGGRPKEFGKAHQGPRSSPKAPSMGLPVGGRDHLVTRLMRRVAPSPLQRASFFEPGLFRAGHAPEARRESMETERYRTQSNDVPLPVGHFDAVRTKGVEELAAVVEVMFNQVPDDPLARVLRAIR